MARPERFELPTPWFVAYYSFIEIYLIINKLRIRKVPYNDYGNECTTL